MIAAFAGYAFSFMEFRGCDTLFIVVVGLWWSPTKSPWCPCSSATTTSE